MLTKKRISLGIIILCTLTVALIFFYPLSFYDTEGNNVYFTIVYTEITLPPNDHKLDTKQFTLEPGSDKLSQIQEVLTKYTYHRGPRSWSSDLSVKGNDAGYWLTIYSENNNIFCGGTGEIVVNNRVYRMGYWGNQKSLAFMEEIRDVLMTP